MIVDRIFSGHESHRRSKWALNYSHECAGAAERWGFAKPAAAAANSAAEI